MLSRLREAWDQADQDQASGLPCLNFSVSVFLFPPHSTSAVVTFLWPEPHHTFLCYCHKCQLISRSVSDAPQGDEEPSGTSLGSWQVQQSAPGMAAPDTRSTLMSLLSLQKKKNPAEPLAQKWGLTHWEELMFFRETGGNGIFKSHTRSMSLFKHNCQALSVWSPALPWTTSTTQTRSPQKAGEHTWTWPHLIPHGAFPPMPSLPETTI